MFEYGSLVNTFTIGRGFFFNSPCRRTRSKFVLCSGSSRESAGFAMVIKISPLNHFSTVYSDGSDADDTGSVSFFNQRKLQQTID
jgi:hypothetical protein